MSESAFERRLRKVSAQLPGPKQQAKSQLERYEQVVEALHANTATEEDFRWIYDNVEGVDVKMRTSLLDAAEKVLADQRRWDDYGYPFASALEILTTPIGSEVPEKAYPALRNWADCLSGKPDKKLESLAEATRPFCIQAVYLMSALGSADGMPLRQELVRRMEDPGSECT
jgi:hypothetical protein